jgi:hypothetical protein
MSWTRTSNTAGVYPDRARFDARGAEVDLRRLARDSDGAVTTSDACPDRPESGRGAGDRRAARAVLRGGLGQVAEVPSQHPGAAITLMTSVCWTAAAGSRRCSADPAGVRTVESAHGHSEGTMHHDTLHALISLYHGEVAADESV